MVTKKMGDLPVYTLKPEKGDGPLRTLNKDLLLPCGFLSTTDEEEPDRVCKPQRPQTRQSTVQPEDNWVQKDDEKICYEFEPSQKMRNTHWTHMGTQQMVLRKKPFKLASINVR